MNETGKEELLAFGRAAIARAQEIGSVLPLRGIALFDTAKDEIFTTLDTFETARDALAANREVQERYGVESTWRLVLQFAYELMERLDGPVPDDAAVEEVWRSFVAELDRPDWTCRGVANLTNFFAHEYPLDLGDGVTIRGRSREDLTDLGFREEIIDALFADWFGFGSSSFVIVAESHLAKTPDNLILRDSATPWTNARRTIEAMRLVAPGDVSFGPMWHIRHALFNVGIGGIGRSGFSIPNIGSTYELRGDAVPAITATRADLARVASVQPREAPANVDLALRSFMSTYDRWPKARDTAVLDCFTALEALLGTRDEITFRLSLRVAGILTATDAERVAMFNEIKAWYGVRSRLVHGGTLSSTQRERLRRVDDLRDVVRRIIRGFIRLTLAGSHGYNRGFFDQDLDATLLEASEREKLRRAMGFV